MFFDAGECVAGISIERSICSSVIALMPPECSNFISRGTRSAQMVLEPVGRHFGVPDRVLDVLVPEVVLQSPRGPSFALLTQQACTQKPCRRAV